MCLHMTLLRNNYFSEISCGGYIDIFIEIYVMSSILKKCILKASAQSIRILWIFS